MRLGALGLPSSDPCYDTSRTILSWPFESLWNTDAECQCLIDSGRPIGEQCPSFKGVVQTMAGQAGDVVGAGANAVGQGIGSGVASGVSNFAGSLDFSGLMLIALIGLGIYAFKR